MKINKVKELDKRHHLHEKEASTVSFIKNRVVLLWDANGAEKRKKCWIHVTAKSNKVPCAPLCTHILSSIEKHRHHSKAAIFGDWI